MNPQGVYLPKGNSEDGEGFRFVGPIFIVPANFSEGIVDVGKRVEVPVAAKDATDWGKASDLAHFTVNSASLVDDLDSDERIDNENVSTPIRPAGGKILLVDLGIESKALFSFQTSEFSVSSSGMSRASSGTIRIRGKASVGSAGYSPAVGTKLNPLMFFVVPEQEGTLKLHFRGEEIADIPVKK